MIVPTAATQGHEQDASPTFSQAAFRLSISSWAWNVKGGIKPEGGSSRRLLYPQYLHKELAYTTNESHGAQEKFRNQDDEDGRFDVRLPEHSKEWQVTSMYWDLAPSCRTRLPVWHACGKAYVDV